MKILIVRLSSIGDIVLTTPVIRCLKQQKSAEIHYLIFRRFKDVVAHNPYIDELITIERSIHEVIPLLKSNRYDLVVDLHRNIRTFVLKNILRRPSVSFFKLNFRKYLLVNFKLRLMPDVHIVDRYLEPVRHLGVINDNSGLDYFINDSDRSVLEGLPESFRVGYICFVIGGRYITKIYPPESVSQVIEKIGKPVILLGGKEDWERGETIISQLGRDDYGKSIINGCGLYSLNESAAIIEFSSLVITNDTGLMHIASALKKKIISIWGNTTPELGMYPYLPSSLKADSIILEDKTVKCRPCSKLGYKRCPKTHFNCMLNISPEEVVTAIKKLLAD